MGLAKRASYLKDIKKILQTKWPANRTINLIYHGHSVPSGYFDTPDVSTFGAFPHLAHVLLKKKYPFAVINTIITAIGGENSISGSKRFDRDVLRKDPDVLMIDYSLNDPFCDRRSLEKYWGPMIRKAKKSGIKVILFTPTPDQRKPILDASGDFRIKGGNVKWLAAKYGTGLVDSTSLFIQELKKGVKLPSLMSHVNHPNGKGHALVAKELARWF